jgi:hypothetical protein
VTPPPLRYVSDGRGCPVGGVRHSNAREQARFRHQHGKCAAAPETDQRAGDRVSSAGGARRFAFNWALAQVKANQDQWAAETTYDIPKGGDHWATGRSAIGAARPPGWWRRRRSARPRRMRSGGRTRAANRPASSQSRPPHELSNGHKGQRLSGAGRVSCRAKPLFQLPLRVRLEIPLASNAVRLTAIRAPLRTDPRTDLCCEQHHHHLACREPNKGFGTHLRRRIGLRGGAEFVRAAACSADRSTCGDQGSGDRRQPLIPGAPGFGWLVPLPQQCCHPTLANSDAYDCGADKPVLWTRCGWSVENTRSGWTAAGLRPEAPRQRSPRLPSAGWRCCCGRAGG